MSRARNLADIISGQFDVPAAALDNVDALPSQTGSGGKYLTTDGSIATWDSIAVGGIFFENNQVVRADYTLISTKNAMTAGPISVDSGAEWTIV